MRKKIIAGNWKMNHTTVEINKFMEELTEAKVGNEDVEAIICGPFPYLSLLVDKANHTALKIGAQNMHFEENGAFTGEVSPLMLNDLNISHVIIGHSERREYFAETDETVNKKVQAAFANNLTPIVCVGETLEQREAGEMLSHIEKQVTAALNGLTGEQVAQTIIAYEPIWAIGTGRTASSAEANEVCVHIRQVVRQLFTEDIAERVIIQYGGSVNPDNIRELLSQTDIDGALVGGASLKAASFLQLLEESK